MRVAIITETFAPDINGVANTVVRVADHLIRRGHRPLVIAPHPTSSLAFRRRPDNIATRGYPVVRVPSVPMLGYPTFRIGLPSVKVVHALTRFAPDIVHLANPFALGAHGLAVAKRLGLSTTAVYQTDVPRFAAGYGLGFARAAAWRWLRTVHNLADRTLAPSTSAIKDLVTHGIERVHMWRRGVDADRFHPRNHDAALRCRLTGGGTKVLVGYVGRLAPEKHLELLAPVTHMRDVSLVVIGAGPARASLELSLPRATFLGELTGDELGRAFASLDIFVHTGPFETFCQTIQEALASGVPVVAPNRGGPRDLVIHGQTGLFFRPDDSDDLASAISRLVADDEQRSAMAAAARPSIDGRSWDVVCDELIEHYTDVLAIHSSRHLEAA